MLIKNKNLEILLNVNFNLFFDKRENKLILKGKLGTYFFFLPSYYFYKEGYNKLQLIFLKEFYYLSFLRHFIYIYNKLFNLFFFRLRLKGLGFRIKKIYKKKIYRIFFGINNYYYLLLPKNIIVKIRKRNILAVSNNKVLLNDFYYQLLLLRKFDYFINSGGFLPRNKIVFLKNKKKNV